MPEPPDTLLIGIAPTGGRLPDDWRATILEAIEPGPGGPLGPAHVPRRRPRVLGRGRPRRACAIVDYRRPPERKETAVGRPHAPGKRVILTVGTDCAIGKMSVALELRKSALAAGDRAVFVPTGQTGMMIDGWGVAVDRVISDFVQGTVEWMLEEAEERGDWIIVEGQGSLDHPAYSSVTLGLIHGSTPHAMVMVHKPGLAAHDFDHRPGRLVPDREAARVHRAPRAGGGARRSLEGRGDGAEHLLYPSEDEARRVIDEIAAETGLPTDDPVRFGGRPPVAPRSATRRRRCPGSRAACRLLAPDVVSLALRHEVLRLALRDPFRIARSEHGSRPRWSRPSSSS